MRLGHRVMISSAMALWDLVLDAFSRLKTPRTWPDEWQLLQPMRVNEDGWLEGADVVIMKAHPSWHYPKLSTPTGDPLAIVAHCSDTKHGTAEAMAKRRMVARKPTDRAASWHVSVEAEQIIQMVSLEAGAWHASKSIPGVGPANRTAVGIELVGYPAGPWPERQVQQAARVWRAIVQSYGIPRARAMVAHSSIEPMRGDPGKAWERDHAEMVLAYALA
jgi:N-acetylmuramoyl-L-alanine amidase